MTTSIEQIQNGVSIVAKEYPLKRVELFGSLAAGRGTTKSDVDLLVEFATPRVSLLTLNRLKYRLEELLCQEVDLIHGPLAEGSLIEIEERVALYGA